MRDPESAGTLFAGLRFSCPRTLSTRLVLVIATALAASLVVRPPAAAGPGTPDLTASITHAPELTPSGYIRFAIAIANIGVGPTDGSTVTVDMSLSPGLSAQIISAENWTSTFRPLRSTRTDGLGPGASYEPIVLYVRPTSPPPPTATITVTISGGGDTSPGNDTAGDVFPLGPPTSTELSVTPNPVVFGEPVTVTATVSSADGSRVPGGAVVFRDGATALGSADLASGRAGLAGVVLSVGAHTLTATYGGDGFFKGSDSPPLTVEIGRAAGALTAVDTAARPGAPALLQAALDPAVSGRSIDFAVGETPAGRSITDESGRAVLAWTVPFGIRPGPLTYTAAFAGDESITGVVRTASLTVLDVPPTLGPVADQADVEGQTVSLAVVGSDDNGEALFFEAVGLPPGLGIDPATGVIGGTVSGAAAAGSPYHVSVVASDPTPANSAVGTSPDSCVITFTWIVGHDGTPPVWPIGGELSVSEVTESSMRLTWPAAADNASVAGYRLYLDGVLAAELAPTDGTYLLTGLVRNTTYNGRVQAGDAAGNWSVNGPTITVTTALGPPDMAITPSNGWLQGGQVITLSFPGQPGVSACYRLHYEQSPEGTAFGPAAPLTGEFAADDRQLYSAAIVIPPDAGYWRNLVLMVRAEDQSGGAWESCMDLDCLVDAVPPVITAAGATVTRDSGLAALSIDLEGESGLTAEALVSDLGVAVRAALSPGSALLPVPLPEDPLSPGHYHGRLIPAADPRSLQILARAVDAAGNETQMPVATTGPGGPTAPAVASFALVTPPRSVGGVAYYHAGETITFEVALRSRGRVVGGAPGRLSVTIPGLPPIPLAEVRPGSGVYRGSYLVRDGDSTASSLNTAGITRASAIMTDPSGRETRQISSFRLAIDTSPPDASDLTAGALTTRAAAAVLKFTLAEPSRVLVESCRDGGSWERGRAQKTAYLPPGRRAIAVVLPASGVYRFRLTLTDRAANTRAVEFPTTVTRVKPAPRKRPAVGP